MIIDHQHQCAGPTMNKLWKLTNRALLRVSGDDVHQFLQGLLTNDIGQANGIQFTYILNAKGRIVHDLFAYNDGPNSYILECDKQSITNLERLLKMYRLRSKVAISAENSLAPVFSVSSGPSADPRVRGFGYRFLQENSGCEDRQVEYLERRLEWGIAEGPEELADQLPLNANGDIMNGINFDKGCYIGQELVARTHHTGIVRKRMTPFHCPNMVSGNIVNESGKRIGRIIQSTEMRGLALVNVDAIGNPAFVHGTKIELYRPVWWNI